MQGATEGDGVGDSQAVAAGRRRGRGNVGLVGPDVDGPRCGTAANGIDDHRHVAIRSRRRAAGWARRRTRRTSTTRAEAMAGRFGHDPADSVVAPPRVADADEGNAGPVTSGRR